MFKIEFLKEHAELSDFECPKCGEKMYVVEHGNALQCSAVQEHFFSMDELIEMDFQRIPDEPKSELSIDECMICRKKMNKKNPMTLTVFLHALDGKEMVPLRYCKRCSDLPLDKINRKLSKPSG